MNLKLFDLLVICLRRIFRNRRTYSLVIISISLGVSGLIIVLSMSREIKKSVNNDLYLIGRANILKLYFENRPDQKAEWFRDDTVKSLRRQPGVQYASLTARGWAYVTVKDRRHLVQIIAVDDYFWELNNYFPSKGRFFGSDTILHRNRNVVIGNVVAKRLFNTNDIVGKSIDIDSDIFNIAGILSGLAPINYQDAIFLPLTTAQDRIFRLTPACNLYIRTLTWDDVPKVTNSIISLIKKQQPSEGIVVEVQWENLKKLKKISWYIEFLAYLAVISALFIGGMGIWNMMMAAVQARTREIGLKKAMGAEDRDILLEFLLEAICMSFTAATIGIIIAMITIEILNRWLGSQSSGNFFLLCTSLGMLLALGLGIGAGLFPSFKASRKDVIDAMRAY